MELTLLTVPACPSAAAFEERLTVALAGRGDVVIRRREISDEHAAAQVGMHGSPTLLINGTDPFAPPGEEPSLSCRIYRDADGRPAPAPSAEALRQALAAASRGQPGTGRRPGTGPALPEQSREDTDIGWGEYPEPDDGRLYRDRPPHWDDR